MGRIQLTHTYEDIISIENLLEAWQGFLTGKRNKNDVIVFSRSLMDNIIQLHRDLVNGTYHHEGYRSFNISDPKPRHIHKASVRDRLLHHAIYRQLYPFFDKTFIADSYSCRINKGTHKALKRFQMLARQVSRNNTKTCWVLQCDIRQFFASIDQTRLIQILQNYIRDERILWLLKNVIQSFKVRTDRGVPLGNLTSQLFVNIYMNEFDQFIKHRIKAKQYIRYADDFVLLSDDKDWLISRLSLIQEFLIKDLKLSLHPQKVKIRTLASGVDFLGWVHFPEYRVLRTTTGRRMFKRIAQHPVDETLQSYLGLLKHGNTYKLQAALRNKYGLWMYPSDNRWSIGNSHVTPGLPSRSD